MTSHRDGQEIMAYCICFASTGCSGLVFWGGSLHTHSKMHAFFCPFHTRCLFTRTLTFCMHFLPCLAACRVAAERAQEFQKAYHEAGKAMGELIGEPGFVEQVGVGVGRVLHGASWGAPGFVEQVWPVVSVSVRALLSSGEGSHGHGGAHR